MSVLVPPAQPRPLPKLAFDAADTPPTLRAAYSDRTAALMAAMCDLVYFCPEQKDRVAVALMDGGFTLAAVTARTLLATSPHLAVLAWRGTDCAADWRLDLSARRVPLPSSPTLRVHQGFLTAFLQDRVAVEAAIATHVKPDMPLYVAGHSLGGALAQIAAAELDSDALAACYTYGSPRVGTRDFDLLVHTPHYRVVNAWDLVPGVPAPFLRGYRHSGDPRLLLPHVDEALRRDRSVAGRFVVDVAASLTAAVTRRLPIVDDHMIWNYRAELERIALARASDHAALAV